MSQDFRRKARGRDFPPCCLCRRVARYYCRGCGRYFCTRHAHYHDEDDPTLDSYLKLR
jgi:hypothetical protein